MNTRFVSTPTTAPKPAPDQWKPPLVSYWCTYATDWIVVKVNYGLTITVPEKNALETMLQHC